jgi:hypothetical protein
MNELRKGQVEYGARAFDQDAGQAIRGDIIRALIELVTNADDAYGQADGGITIRVLKTDDERTPTEIRVHDHAKGLDAEGLLRCFSVLGGEREADENGFQARGLLGRGAKDVASLGHVTFAAIRSGRFSRMQLDSSGWWQLTNEDEPATDAQYEALLLEPGQNGLTASMFIDTRFAVPTKAKFQEKLSHHAQLRELIGRREVRLQDVRGVALMAVLQPRPTRGEVVLDQEISLSGWDIPVHLTVRRLPQRVPGLVNEYSEHGLLVQSGVSAFENTWFDLESRPEAGFFVGEVSAPQIAEIIRAFDRRDPLGGPVRLLSRDRDGLVLNHPYRKELARVVSREVKPIFDQLASQLDASRHQGEKLSKAFKVATAALKDQVVEILNEIDEDDPHEGGGGSNTVDSLMLIPPRRVARPGEMLTFTLRSSAQPASAALVGLDHQSRDDVLASLAGDEAPWAPHPRLPAFQSRIFATVGLQQGTAVIRAEVDGKVARAAVVVTEDAEDQSEVPEGLEISPHRATMSPTRGKRITVRAPIEFAGQLVEVAYEGVSLAELPNAASLSAEVGGRWAHAVLHCRAGASKGDGLLTVSTVGLESATCTIVVDEAAGRGGPQLDFDLSAHRSPQTRSRVTNDAGLIKVIVYGLHPTFAGMFGRYSDAESKFAEEDSARARTALAEVVANELAAFFTERDYEKRPEELNDATRVLRKQKEFADRLLTTLHRALSPES